MRTVLAAVVLSICGCATVSRAPRAEPPLQDEGQVYVYLAPFPFESRRLAFTVDAVAAVGPGGDPVPLTVRLQSVSAAEQGGNERMLAFGRLPRGGYGGLQLKASNARLSGDDRPVNLVVDDAPLRIDAAFEIRSGQATVVTVSIDPKSSPVGSLAFAPRFTGSVPARTPPPLAGACVNTQTNDVTLFDTWTKRVTNVVATGQSPYGVALDPAVARGWVALSGQDQLDVVDLSRSEVASRIPLRGGSEPRAMQMLPDRRTLLVANYRSQTASFVDAFTTQELAQVRVGEAPWSIVLQRRGNRAFVLNRRSNSMTIVDLGTRQAIGSISTEPEPLFGQVSRDGTRLYVIHAGSPFMTEYALPGLTVSRKIRVGLGASAIRIDPRTDLIYVGHLDDDRLEVYDSLSALPVDAFDVPGWVSSMAIDDPQDQLFALMPGRRAIAVVDLTSRKVLSIIDVSGEPYEVRLPAERN